MNTEYRLRRLERTLGTLVSWLPNELGSNNMRSLLDTLTTPEGPDTFALKDPTIHTPTHLILDLQSQLAEVSPECGFTSYHIARVVMKWCDDAVKMLANPNCLEGPGRTPEEWLSRQREKFAAIDRELETVRKERDEARSLVAAFESAVNQHCTFDPPIEKDRAVSEADYIFRLNKELRERVEKVIGHWRHTDWFIDEASFGEITVGVDAADAIKLLKYLKP